MNICGIYKITSPLNKIYIGQSIDCVSRKLMYARLACKSQILLYRSIKKHGWDKHKFEIIHQCEPSELNYLEKYYIDLFQSFNSKKGLNLTNGGEINKIMSDVSKERMSKSHIGKSFSDETKRKMSESRSGGKNYLFGKHLSKETRKKISESHKGKMAWNKGLKGIIKDSEETKEKKRKAMMGRDLGKKYSQEFKNKNRLKHLGQVAWNKDKKGIYSEETKRKMSEALKGRIAWNKGLKMSDEFKNKVKESMRLWRIKRANDYIMTNVKPILQISN